MQWISILGSTGSIGKQTLDVVRNNPHLFKVHSLSAFKNFSLLAEQVREFSPKIVVTSYETVLKSQFKNVQFKTGPEALLEIASNEEVALVVVAIVGIAALKPLESAIKAGKKIALANKESIVAAGHILMPLANKHNSKIVPVDSEHNAIFRLLRERENLNLSSVTLIASGGPFLNRPLESFKNITVREAVKHPHWKMGKKISVDSATMMNKGLELIEAKWLFDLNPSQIRTSIQKDCSIHAMVEFENQEQLALFGKPDMRGPIAYALFWPEKAPNLENEVIGAEKISKFSFSNIDFERFPAFKLAKDVLDLGSPGKAVILTGSNEVAVEAFLAGEIRFDQISTMIEESLSRFPNVTPNTVTEVLTIDREVRIGAKETLRKLKQM